MTTVVTLIEACSELDELSKCLNAVRLRFSKP